jgi:valyl-tRNA synthetase
MYYFKYFVKDSLEFVVVATTRPETMFVDTNVFVNPDDERYKHIIGKYLINPINDEPLLVLADKYIDKEFGTGVMKCTPAHDFNDYKLANTHKITNFKSTINYDGTLNENAKTTLFDFQGIDRLTARPLIVEAIEKKGLLVKIEDHESQIGYSERTNEVVEPLLSKQ